MNGGMRDVGICAVMLQCFRRCSTVGAGSCSPNAVPGLRVEGIGRFAGLFRIRQFRQVACLASFGLCPILGPVWMATKRGWSFAGRSSTAPRGLWKTVPERACMTIGGGGGTIAFW